MTGNCFIFTGGELHSLPEKPSTDDLVIAADSGYTSAKKFGVTPDLVIGDFDSLAPDFRESEELSRIQKITASPIKDDTDTQLAVETAISQGATKIIILGGLGGRVDHTLSNIFLLEYLLEKGIDGRISDGKNRIGIIVADGEKKSVRVKKEYEYLSLVSLSDVCRGVSVSGVFYPLENAEITRKYTYAVSNKITADFAEISICDGKMLIIESMD